MRALDCIDPGALPDALLRSTEPVLLRGLVAHWPAAQAGRQGAADAAAYLRRFWRDATVGVWLGPPDIEGRFFYDEALTGFNFHRETAAFGTVIETLLSHAPDPRPPAIYVGSTTVDTCLPGFNAENGLGFGRLQPLTSLWVGNRARVAAHYDLPDNLACVVAGRRRFTLLPPDQVGNLYVGPLDLTPAGQPISLVDFAQPDLARFPKFAEAQRHARVAELGPGDALFIPSMWWHHVEALDAFNVLVNHWWRDVPPYMDSPQGALLLALLTLRDLPPEQRRAWQGLFDHYVFAADAHTAAHIPAPARGALALLDDAGARMLRARVQRALNR
jgi:hypothetical protein